MKGIIMQFEHTEHKGEELMTDLQFLEYKSVRDELEGGNDIGNQRCNCRASQTP